MKVIVSLMIMACLYALSGATMPNIGDFSGEIKAPKMEKQENTLPPLEQENKVFQKEFKDGKKILIKGFIFDGAIQLSPTELQTIVKPYDNKMLSFQEIQQIVTLITKTYHDKGYFVAKAYLPIQNLQKQNRLLKIAIVEGAYGEFEVDNNSLVKDSIIQARLETLKNNKSISIEALERSLLLINDLAGARVESSRIKAGKKVGTSDFIIGVEATKPYDGYLLLDNYGSRYTGRYKTNLVTNIYSPFERGDQLSFSVSSSQNSDLLGGGVYYYFPISKDGLRGELSYARINYELGKEYESLDANGYSNRLTSKFIYPFIRSRNENLDIYLQTTFDRANDKIDAVGTENKKDIFRSALGFEYIQNKPLYGKPSQFQIESYLTIGKVSFKDQENKEDDEAGANTNGSYSKLNIEVNQNILLTEKFLWKNRLQLQYAFANKNLDGIEDLSLGGYEGVRLYPISEESAENGYLYNIELLYTLPSFQDLNSQVGIFYDIGRVYMSQNVTDEPSRTLQDIGLSYYASYQDFILSAYMAYKVGGADVTSEDDYSSKFMFQLGYIF